MNALLRYSADHENQHCCHEARILRDGQWIGECLDPVDAFLITEALNRLTDDEIAAIRAPIEHRLQIEEDAAAEAERRRKPVWMAREYGGYFDFDRDTLPDPASTDFADWWDGLNHEQRRMLS